MKRRQFIKTALVGGASVAIPSIVTSSVETEIKKINAQTKALKDGGGLITIKADGLEPEIEAFMREILKTMQYKKQDRDLFITRND